jgi:hypothetical protein
MRERASKIGAALEINSALEHGTTVRVTWHAPVIASVVGAGQDATSTTPVRNEYRTSINAWEGNDD